MNKIEQVNGYGDLRAIGRTEKAGSGAGGQREQAVGGVSGKEDQVEISQKALMMSKLAMLPEIRTEKVEQVRRELANGTYDVNGKLSVALDRFLDEYVG